MTGNEGPNVNQGGVETLSTTAQSMQNGKPIVGDSHPQPALNEDLLQRVLLPENLQAAWKQVKRNQGAPGVDGITIEGYPEWAKRHWAATRRALEGGYYIPQPIRRVEIPKPNRGKRLLGIATVNDRVIQQALHQVLTPLIDPTFSQSSYGFRPGRNAHGVVKQIIASLASGRLNARLSGAALLVSDCMRLLGDIL